ncbi:MAG: Thymidine phosphorylase [Alphaproteobacteria bacterium MarineAlpha5_Bin9]|nr:MAG: Thymidine phosphorylase [Alphaproteobacteria bacterium MarineAlpha5_Bin9]|tara:strand:- start:5167 stop:6474 length:1308 start_codon:yes stop_codon:yes gene_type:complete
MIPQEIIRKKRNKLSLSDQDIHNFVGGIISGDFSDEQIASLSMAIFLNGLSEHETIQLTKEMTNSGDILDWKNYLDPELVCDKHSTGGVGDKVSIILAPILAACGVYVPMISGRGLGHTGGTLDKFESIPGYNTRPGIKLFQKVVKEVGCAIIGQTEHLAPADKKLYAIRDVVGTVESLPLITSSILSKKISAGLKNLIIDVKTGDGSFNANKEVAKELADSLIKVARGAGLNCKAIITDMNQVLGFNAGHSIEIKEAIEYLINKNKNERLEVVTNELSSSLLSMVKNIPKKEALKIINENVDNGRAAEKFEKMVFSLGGKTNFINSYQKDLNNSYYKKDIFSSQNGFVNYISLRKLALILVNLGGGRKKADQKIDYYVGFENVLECNSKVDKKTPLLTVHAKTKEEIDVFYEKIQECFIISDKPIVKNPIIYSI